MAFAQVYTESLHDYATRIYVEHVKGLARAPLCPFCGDHRATVFPPVDQQLTHDPGDIQLINHPRQVIPMVPVVCRTCLHVRFVPLGLLADGRPRR